MISPNVVSLNTFARLASLGTCWRKLCKYVYLSWQHLQVDSFLSVTVRLISILYWQDSREQTGNEWEGEMGSGKLQVGFQPEKNWWPSIWDYLNLRLVWILTNLLPLLWGRIKECWSMSRLVVSWLYVLRNQVRWQKSILMGSLSQANQKRSAGTVGLVATLRCRLKSNCLQIRAGFPSGRENGFAVVAP